MNDELKGKIQTLISGRALDSALLEEIQNVVSDHVKKERSKRDHWKANHDNIVKKLRLFTQREDLPVDRLPAYRHILELECVAKKAREAIDNFPMTVGQRYTNEGQALLDVLCDLDRVLAGAGSEDNSENS